jgi:hypothetical protein
MLIDLLQHTSVAEVRFTTLSIKELGSQMLLEPCPAWSAAKRSRPTFWGKVSDGR